MTVNGKTRFDAIGPVDVVAEARRWALDEITALAATTGTAEAVAEAAASLGGPGRLIDMVIERCRAFLARAS